MPIKIAAALFILIASVFGFQVFRRRPDANDLLNRGRVQIAVDEAKARNKREIAISAPIAAYAEVRDLDEALANYTTLIAKPVERHSRINPDTKQIETWYKLQVIDFLSQPKSAKCTNCKSKLIPPELKTIEPTQIVVVRNSGSVVLDGVKVSSTERAFPDFKMSQTYLLFLSLDLNTRVGKIDLGQAGVSVVETDGQISSLADRGRKLSVELKERYGKIDQVKAGLKFRRFPE